MSEKRVVAVIVEGPSDENAIGGILKEYFASEEVQFAVVHGDITSDEANTVDDVVKKVEETVDGIRGKYGYKWTDFVQVIHIADTDGAFANDCVVEADTKGILYYEDHIESSNVDATNGRNAHKSEIMFKLYSTGRVHGICYRIYFNSCNLEHVLHGKLENFSNEKKEEMSDRFAEKYEGKLDDFIAFISDSKLAVSGNYKKTWKYIEKDEHSLERHSNMHLIFEK